jgi:prepilin-type N-terminal cleavage/methylation domain-containing protein
MWAKHKQQAGLTIVELLIVIVVIAVLAAISIVAYNGILRKLVRCRSSSIYVYIRGKLRLHTFGH